MDRIGIRTPEEALAEVVRAEAATAAAGTPVAELPQPVRTKNLAVAAEQQKTYDLVERKKEAQDEHGLTHLTKQVAAEQRRAATRCVTMEKRAEVERRCELRRRIAAELETIVASEMGYVATRRDTECVFTCRAATSSCKGGPAGSRSLQQRNGA